MQDSFVPPNPTNDSQLPDYLRTSNTPPRTPDADREAAANIVRQKLAAIYADEPNAKQEAEEVAVLQAPLSRHQQYMQSLSTSGRSWAEIQNAWHEYYVNLPDGEKHEVWQEFYATNQASTPFQQHMQQRDQTAAAIVTPTQPQPAITPQHMPATSQPTVTTADFTPAIPQETKQVAPRPSVADIKKRIQDTVSVRGTLQTKDHLKSLAFGLASGAVVVFIFLFGFFNEVLISPFIQPSRQASETPVIVDTASAVVGETPKVLIPKINVEIPTDYTQTTTDNKAIETALDNGIVHYPSTVRPGQAGNAAFFGHSSNNIFNSGKYKFAFVLLHKLVEGDTFYLTYEGKAYAYEVISRRVVEPTEVGVLGPVPNETATATLITCDPPGTSLKRLVVVGRQISPDPGGNVTPQNNPILATAEPSVDLPGNGPTLWSRMWNSVF
ncbi:MAG: hypothetical protein JWP13_221 [Candidatus Saccharibacteria bacterium]|nr:hypothetical protein [Candidatus Saccharibacteria bacterium]